MIKVSQAIEQIVQKDGFVKEAMQRGILNVSAYAKLIHSEVEERTMKPIASGTIVVSLLRVMKKVTQNVSFTPYVTIASFSVTSALAEVTFDKTNQNQEKLNSLNETFAGSDFFTVTEGLHEITIVCGLDTKYSILQHFISPPKIIIDDLVAVSVRFSESYMNTPNTIYSLVGILANQHINLIEIVSTYTELSFIIEKKELDQTIDALDKYMNSPTL